MFDDMEEVRVYEKYIQFVYNLLEGDYNILRKDVVDLRVNRIHLYNRKAFQELEDDLKSLTPGIKDWYANVKYKNPEDRRKFIEVTYQIPSYQFFKKWWIRTERLNKLGI